MGWSAAGLQDFGGTRPRRLFEILSGAQGATVSRRHVAEALWGDHLPRHMSATVDAYVAVLRNRVQRDGCVILAEGDGYRLQAAEVDVEIDLNALDVDVRGYLLAIA